MTEYFKKRKYLALLGRLLDSGHSLELAHYIDRHSVRGSDQFLSWLEKTTHALEEIFGRDSEPFSRFEDLDFEFGGDPHRDLFLEHIAEAKAILKGCIYRITNFGFPIGQLSKTRKLEDDISSAAKYGSTKRSAVQGYLSQVVVGIGLILVTIVATHYIDRWWTMEYKQVEVDYRNWVEDFDISVQNEYCRFLGWNIRTESVSDRALLSGQVRSFFLESRRKLDNKIDSFKIAYSLVGGDTMTFNFRRKLPFNAESRLIPFLTNKDSLALDYIRSLRLDTL